MKRAADATLLIAPGCPHCPQVLAALSELVKEGLIGRLEVINIAAHPEAARAAGTRSVPWMRIGPYELTGLHSPSELRRWAERARKGAGIGPWYREALEEGRLEEALSRIRRHPEELKALLEMLQGHPPIAVRVGISALVEELAGTDALRALIPRLGELTRDPEPATRADAAHYLGLTGDPSAAPLLRALLKDEAEQVREIAREALEALEHPGRWGDQKREGA
ncbi:MAG: HEAT repeat domain-containing protein [Gammaproteobacteria bacterium]|nr:MAG: HEAT repeat domain-containing protein [Gammaproteobacteria bacterium]